MFEVLCFGPAVKLRHTAVAWVFFIILAFCCVAYIVRVLSRSRRQFRRAFTATAAVISLGLLFLDSRYHVRFEDGNGRPVAGGVVEIHHVSYWWGTVSPPYPESNDDGIAYVGLMRASMACNIYIKGKVVDDPWPKKALRQSR